MYMGRNASLIKIVKSGHHMSLLGPTCIWANEIAFCFSDIKSLIKIQRHITCSPNHLLYIFLYFQCPLDRPRSLFNLVAKFEIWHFATPDNSSSGPVHLNLFGQLVSFQKKNFFAKNLLPDCFSSSLFCMSLAYNDINWCTIGAFFGICQRENGWLPTKYKCKNTDKIQPNTNAKNTDGPKNAA